MGSFTYERTLWSWFNKNSMQHVQAVKLKDGGDRPWALIRGRRGWRGHKILRFISLGELIAGMFDHELETLIEKHDIPAMELLAMAADDGEAA